MFSVYILQSNKDKRTYIGFCKNVDTRLQEHNSGKVDATKHRRPFKLLFIEKAKDLKEAKKRERYWKSGGGRRKLKRFFREGFPPSEAGRGSPIL
jgi:putative endonuclease